VDGIPVVVPDPVGFASAEGRALSGALDLGLGRGYDFLGAYGWSAWADRLPAEPGASDLHAAAAAYQRAVAAYAERVAVRARRLPAPVLLDAGCGLGRAALHLSASGLPTVGLDLRFEACVEGARVADGQPPRWLERRPGRGLRFRRVPGAAPDPTEALLFAVADLLRPPLAAGSVAGALALNLLDNVPAPSDLLSRLAELLRPGALLLLSTPLCWNESITPSHAWPLTEERDEQALATAWGDFVVLEPPRELRWVLRKHAREYAVFNAHTVLLERG